MALSKDDIIYGVIAVEGGYVNDPNDLGGETNFGITRNVALANKVLLDKLNWNGKMINLTKEMAYAIYEKQYWASLKLDDVHAVSDVLADKLFDLSVNCGVGRAGTWFQLILNVLNRDQKDYKDIAEDGKVGNGTIAAFNSLISKRGKEKACGTLLKGLFCLQGSHYINISKARSANENFMFGWLSRMNHNLDEYVPAFKK